MLTVKWRGGMAFEAQVPSGNNFVMDAIPEFGGNNEGPTPVEAFLSSAAACSAMDVVSIMEKKRQRVTDYRIEVEWQRPPQGQSPRPILSVIIRHILKGEDLDVAAVQKAVELSDAKYCTVVTTLRHGPAVSSEYRIE